MEDLEKMSLAGKSMEDVAPYLLSGESDEVSPEFLEKPFS